VGLFEYWDLSLRGINKKFIVISSRGKVLHVGRPLQTANFLGVIGVLFGVGHFVVASKVVKHNRVIPGPSDEIVVG
jgi:hypothetical protein